METGASRDSAVLKPMQDNVTPTTTKRLTMVERARLEALAAFGNEGLDSLTVKKTDLSSKLKSTVPCAESKNMSARPLTRMEKARIEASTAFKNVKLGQMLNNPRKRKIQDTDKHENSKKPNQITLTRLQKAKQEAEKAFENVSLDKILPKRSKLEKEKMEKILLEGKKKAEPSKVKQASRFIHPLPNGKPDLKPSKQAPDKSSVVVKVRSVDVNTPKRLTRSQSSKMDVLKCDNSNQVEDPDEHESFKENVDRNLTEKIKENLTDTCSEQVSVGTTIDNVTNITPQSHQDNSNNNGSGMKNGQKRLTRIERAKLEALQSFKGQEFSDICKQSTRIVAKHLKPKKDQSSSTENEDVWNTPKDFPELHGKIEPNHKESFQLKHRSKMPKSIEKVQKRPKLDFYSSITEENFKDQCSLLEISRKVVKTAVELETPEGSPVNAPS